jgi:hypothetical protein
MDQGRIVGGCPTEHPMIAADGIAVIPRTYNISRPADIVSATVMPAINTHQQAAVASAGKSQRRTP